MKRGVKIGIICGVVFVLLLCVGLFVYFNFFAKTSFHIVGVEKTSYDIDDYVKESELQFHKNNTFHVQIEHKEIGLLLTGIGTYTLEGDTYKLTFIEAFARDTNNTIVNILGKSNEITCTRSGNRIKFVDDKAQIYYFG